MALADLSQADYFAQNPNAGFSDYLNYAQGKTAGGQFQAPSSLPPGFLQSEYAPAYNSVLRSFNDPNYDKNSDPNGYAALLKNWADSYAAGKPYQTWQSEAAKSAQGTPIIGGGKYGLDAATVGQIAVGGFGGAAMGSGVGATEGAGATGGGLAGVGEGSASTAATGVTPAATQGVVSGGIGGADTGLLSGAASGGLDEAAMTQAARTASLDSLASQGITTSGAGASTGASTAMSRILDGTATTADWLNVGGNLASTGLGIAGSRNAANSYNNLSREYMAFGAPSRARYEASMAPGFDPNSIPGYSGAVDTASKGILARLAATGGNPWGNPGGLIEANKQIISGTALPAIDAYQRLNAGTGGYAGFNAAAPAAATAGIGAQGGVYNAVGSGLAGLLNPQPSLYDTLRGLGVQGLS